MCPKLVGAFPGAQMGTQCSFLPLTQEGQRGARSGRACGGLSVSQAGNQLAQASLSSTAPGAIQSDQQQQLVRSADSLHLPHLLNQNGGGWGPALWVILFLHNASPHYPGTPSGGEEEVGIVCAMERNALLVGGLQGKGCPGIESFNFSGPLFPHLKNGVNTSLPPLFSSPSFLSPQHPDRSGP